MVEMTHPGEALGAGVGIDESRRKLLLAATTIAGAAGVAFTVVPFIESWLPSESARALGSPTEVDLTKIEPGQMIITVWRRNPIFVVHRTPEMLSLLGSHNSLLKDPQSADSNQPEYCKNTMRSRLAEWYVCIGTCTHLGCLPKPHFDAQDPVLGSYWPGGWLCPCHGSRFDLAGRVFDGSPASINLNIMPYAFASAAKLVVGVDDAAEAQKVVST
ncbi:MAG TPA: ubiquinol-cytochrome c reductase iron-sulfur subunit [Steroidobacteraceae bacterium]|nr:ubiquinol-cytochrome c reductase iron-sulfur subunit [Steroidobacteraceae bacterium]